ncbi:hypothetical protein HW130_25475 [Streptomyces sp. PKU-EA00015]|uniref:hypothetical protein n=1 Tax=Streptomyces sp. PKU-EA00015 TaxID=2748326 RepID=UPI0015A2B9F7|nr:hypothetical protein [Streptomyces sp. PKU-EA00015]NWF29563.1 hypothetical protein [Streptomyces sp. PKU-EA00015]
MRVALPVLAPPWIVVHHTVERVLVSRWPGRLLWVRVALPSSDEERAAMARASKELLPDASYTRAIAVDVLEELSPSVLFGSHGDEVIRVIESGLALDEQIASELASARHPAADREYSKAWNRWLAQQPEFAHYQDQDHTSTLAITGAGATDSPVGHGLLLIWHMVTNSAEHRGSAGSFTVDEDDERVLTEPWSSALSALLDTAMAYGAPHVVDSNAATVLTAAWNTVFHPERADRLDTPPEQS